jgi:hypothetical protein
MIKDNYYVAVEKLNKFNTNHEIITIYEIKWYVIVSVR